MATSHACIQLYSTPNASIRCMHVHVCTYGYHPCGDSGVHVHYMTQAHVRGRKARSKMKTEFEAERKAELEQSQRASRGSPRKKDFDYYLRRGR